MVTTSTELREWRHGRLTFGAVLLTLVLADSPSGAADCDGYIGGAMEATSFWSGVSDVTASFWSAISKERLRACIKVHGANIRGRRFGGTPLHMAARGSDPAIVTMLVDAGGDVEAVTGDGLTPLHAAVAFTAARSPAVIAALLEAGADPDARDRSGTTPLHYAVRGMLMAANTAAIALMHDPDADDPVVDAAVITMLARAGADVDAQDARNLTPLHMAVRSGAYPVVISALLEAGADTEARGVHALTPLHMAAKIGDPAVVTLLLGAGADAEAVTGDGTTPLHSALAHNSRVSLAIITALLEAGADPNARTRFGMEPLHYAAQALWFGAESTAIALLLEAGADPEAGDGEGMTPWDYARDQKDFAGTVLYERLRILAGE